MNILMALSQLEVTGAEVYATTVADELIKRGNKVYIISDTLSTNTEAEYIKLEFNKRSLLKRVEHIKKIYKIIKEKDIHIVHAHSRASSWSCQIACKLANIPLITTTHGRQPVHLSRKIIKGFGEHSIAVCENIKNHISKDLGFKENNITVLRNPINFVEKSIEKKENERKIISIIGRLSGPKGDVTYDLLKIFGEKDFFNEYKIRVIGGKDLPEKFYPFKEQGVEFLGYIKDVQEKILSSDIVIGAGRVAIESILNKVPVIAIGETEYVGLIRSKNLEKALASNFGDIGNFKYPEINKELLLNDIKDALLYETLEKEKLKNIVFSEVNLQNIVDKIEKKYFSLYVKTKNGKFLL